MTRAGIRVPAEPGDYLSPRPFYASKSAGFVAWQGFIHYAELLEAGQGPAAMDLTLKTNGGFPLRDDKLNLAAYLKWSYRAKATREAVEAAMPLASGLTAVQQLLARSAASTFASNFSRIAGQPATTAGSSMTVQGVAFTGVQATRTGPEFFASYQVVENVGRVAGQGKAMHAAFELGTVQAARAAGATTARVGVGHVVNPAWQKHLYDKGYRPVFIDISPTRGSLFWTKVFNL